MKRVLGVLIAVVGVIVAVAIMSKRGQEKVLEAQRELGLARIQKEYLEKAGAVRTTPDPKAALADALSLFRWYFKELDAQQERFGGNRAFDDYLKELEARGGKDPQLSDRKATYGQVKAVFDAFRKGSYAPTWTATDKGIRVDVLEPQIVPSVTGERIRLPVVFWGVPRDLRADESQGRNVKKMLVSASYTLNTKLLDKTGKLFAEMNVAGGPSMKVDWPERYIAEFPPQMVLGYYELERVPAEITKTELTFDVSAGNPVGSPVNAQMVWKLDPPANWKLRAGEKWENTQDSVRGPEEINPGKAAR